MKILLLIFAFISISNLNIINAQFEHASLTIGYVNAKMTLETFSYTFDRSLTEGEPGTFSNQVGEKFSLPRINIGGEILTNKFFLFAGTNMSLKIPREVKALNDGVQHKVYEKNVLYMKAAAGFGSDKISFLIGGQYEFNRFEFQGGVSTYSGLNNVSGASHEINASGNYAFDFFGGHQYGINLNLLIAPAPAFALRTSLFLDRTKMNGIPKNVHFGQQFKGGVITSEIALYIYPNPDKNYGLKMSYYYAKRTMESTSHDLPNYIPENTSKTTYLNFSLLLGIPGFDDI